ncbi:L,D-transpeptidase [Pseudooceanicola sp. 502str34]
MTNPLVRKSLALLALPVVLALAACGAPNVPSENVPTVAPPSAETLAMYSEVLDGEKVVPAVPAKYLTGENPRQRVYYYAPYPVGTLVVDTGDQHLYELLGDNQAMRYAVAVGEAGRAFAGEATIAYQRDWPTWTPTRNMLRREPEKYEPYRAGMEGGLDNPLGARALYLYKNGRDTLYRIHGTPYPWSVGHAVSSGCIRLFNQDAMYLAERVDNGTKVIVLTADEIGKWTRPAGEPIPVQMQGQM